MTCLKLLTHNHLIALVTKIVGPVLIAVTSFAIVTPILADNGNTTSELTYSSPSTTQAFINTLPTTSDPIENEARDFFVFLEQNEPEFVAEFIRVYQPALQKILKDDTLEKRYVVLAAKDFILDKTQYFGASLLTEAQITGFEAKLAVDGVQEKREIYDKFMRGNIDSTAIQNINALEEDIRKGEEYIRKLNEDIKKLDEYISESNKKLDYYDKLIEQLGRE